MTTLCASDLTRDESLSYALLRYRDETTRELFALNRPRLLRVLEDVKPAVAKVLEGTEK